MSIGEILAAIPTQSQDLRERGYKFSQTKALNDAWSSSFVRSADGAIRPDENRYMAAIAKAGLGPEAGMAYWQYQTGQFENAQRQSDAANAIAFNGGNFRTITGPAPESTVTEAPSAGDFGAPAQPSGLSEFLRPKPKGPIDLSGGSSVDAMTTGAADGEVVVRGQVSDTRAPEVGTLPPLELDRTYAPPASEGVATQFARSINPTMPGMMEQGMYFGAEGAGLASTAPALSFETMNPTERQYAERFLARGGTPGTPDEQLREFERRALAGVVKAVPYNPMRARVLGPNGRMMLDPSKLAEEQNRAKADEAREAADTAKAITEARKALFGAYEGIQAPTIARAGAESSLLEKSRPIVAANDAIAALNQELGTSFDPSKMGTPEVASEVLERVRLQKNLAQRADSLEVVRGPDGTIDGRATLSQIIPMLEGMAKLEGLSGTEGTQKMMIGLLAPKLDAATMLAAGMIDPAGGLTGAGIQYLAGRVNDIPIEQVRKLARHMVDASPGMAGIYQTYQSKTPRAMPVAGLDSFSGSSAAPAKTDPLAAFLRPSGAKADQKPPKSPREAKGVTPAQFDRQWAAARPGDKVVGPDGKTYTKGGR